MTSLLEKFVLPGNTGKSVTEYADAYIDSLSMSLKSADLSGLSDFIKVIDEAEAKGSSIFVFGNGGSSAIANHLQCDYLKSVSQLTTKRLRVISLTSSTELITAYGNDIDFSEIFSSQLEALGSIGDVCIAISSSGNSPNILNGVRAAKKLGLTTLGLTGFDGGELLKMGDHVIHVKVNNYGIVEDSHQMIMHVIAQYISKRQAALCES